MIPMNKEMFPSTVQNLCYFAAKLMLEIWMWVKMMENYHDNRQVRHVQSVTTVHHPLGHTDITRKKHKHKNYLMKLLHTGFNDIRNKLPDSHWLRAVQFFVKTVQK